jgi:hypothetical protein
MRTQHAVYFSATIRRARRETHLAMQSEIEDGVIADFFARPVNLDNTHEPARIVL